MDGGGGFLELELLHLCLAASIEHVILFVRYNKGFRVGFPHGEREGLDFEDKMCD